MIITYKDIDNLSIKFNKIKKFSEDYSFIPITIKSKNINNSLIQTPYLYVPYGNKVLENNREIVDISFMNISNDNEISKFYDLLKKIEKIVIKKYCNNYKINEILRNTEYNYSMRLKINNSKHFNQYKQPIKKLNPNIYSRFIIDLYGLWIYQNEIWFQWYLIQSESIEPYNSKNEYMFIDTPIPIPIKSKKYIPPPPPPPLPKFKQTSNKIVINKQKKKIPPPDKHFAPPSLEELQITLSKLKKT